MLKRVLIFGVAWLCVLSMVCNHVKASSAQTQPIELQPRISVPFHFIAFGDTRFTDPSNTAAANAAARQALVSAIAKSRPAFVSIGGDIVYNGSEAEDWRVWDAETRRWRDKKIWVYPAIGNHDLKGDEKIALANYFQRFPELHQNRYYSVRLANCLMLVLDSALDEVSGPQGDWVKQKLDAIPADVAFVIIVMHHPPYTSSSDAKKYGGGHSARATEQAFGKLLEARQSGTRARFVVFTGHVHNYERHEHGGITYFVTGGGGAHAYPIERSPDDKFQSTDINYHYLLAEVTRDTMTITMHRLQLQDGKATWSEPDRVKIVVPVN